MDTITNEACSKIIDFELFASSTQAAIVVAQHEANKMNAPEVYPEHLFLAVVRQDDVEITTVLKKIGLDKQKVQEQAIEIFGVLNEAGTTDDLLFSCESLTCFEWAISFAAQMDSSLLFPKHLLLSVLRHPRIQPLLVLLQPSQDQDVLPAPLIEVEGSAYTNYIDQLIYSRVREQSITNFKGGSQKRVFRRIERPHITFEDIQGLDGAKDALREAVEFLRKPQIFQQSKRTYLYGALIVGHPCTDRTLLVKAVAGEAVVPLLYLSLSALMGLFIDLDSQSIALDELDLSIEEYELLAGDDTSQRGQKMIAHMFRQARRVSPCVLFIDNLDAVNHFPTNLEPEQVWKQVAIEMDGLNVHPPMAVVASTNQIDQLVQALLLPGRFEHKVVMTSGFMAHPVVQVQLCRACKNEVLSTWKYCVYCGAFLSQTCPNCGTIFMPLQGARYCSECGTIQRNTQNL